jgi:cytochrome c biogenesis protein CcdA/thiol-disulfide isomerase/thioredoxin
VIGLLFIGLLAGVIAGVSPCILPILPVIFVGWTAPVVDEEHPLRARRRRAVAVVLGLVVSFGVITALGSVILSSLGLPQNFLRDLGIALLVLFGVGLLIPNVEHLLERPFARLTRAAPTGNKSGFVFGLGLGLVFVPCAGPVLSAVSTLGARHHASLFSVLLSFFFAVGAAIPLFAIALAGDRVIERDRNLSRTARRYRPVAGALLIVMALAIGFNAVSALQRWLPTYTQSLQHLIERNSYVTHQLHSLEYANASNGSLSACVSAASQTTVNGLQSCGIAPEFTGITNWLNTPGNRPLTLAGLRGHVVLVDFWTYSCINCQRTLPHVEAWYAKYHRYGFDVIGVEAPEFAFEHVLSNIAGAAGSLGVRYPIAVDDNLGTWTAYQNNYWPAEYLVGPNGVIRHVAYGDGDYGMTESYIRSLLVSAHPSLALPAPSDLPNLTPTEATNPETYLGTDRSQYMVGTLAPVGDQTYTMPASVPLGYYGLGGTWHSASEDITAARDAQLTLGYQAQHIYLVLGGSGTVRVLLNGVYSRTVTVGGSPTLYTLLSQSRDASGHVTLQVSAGVSAYDFTFG